MGKNHEGISLEGQLPKKGLFPKEGWKLIIIPGWFGKAY